MTTRWKTTGLSMAARTVDGRVFYDLPMADTDRRAIQVDAGEPITGATASLTNLDTGLAEIAPIEGVTVNTPRATVTVSNLTRNTTYELAVTFSRLDNTRWTRTLILECVA